MYCIKRHVVWDPIYINVSTYINYQLDALIIIYS